MDKYYYNDIVYLLDDVTYNDKKLKRGQELFVIKHELNRLECIIDGSDEVYVFTDCFVTDNPSNVLWSKAFIRVLLDNIMILLCYLFVFIIIIELLFN